MKSNHSGVVRTQLTWLTAAAALGAALAAPLPAQDHAAHAALLGGRPLGGRFELRAVNGQALPAEFPRGSGARITGGSLELKLATVDSGTFALRFTATPSADAAAETTGPSGTVRVRADSLLFWPEHGETGSPVRFRYAWTADRAIELTDALGNRWDYAPAGADADFANVQSRGAGVMGVDQYTSSHVFETLADGGRIVLQRDVADAAGEATIRAHMADIAKRFTAGDFSLPGQVHGMTVPGTAVMAARKAQLSYEARDLPRGAEVRITTRDAVALKAVHEFLAFQRLDHRAAGHDH